MTKTATEEILSNPKKKRFFHPAVYECEMEVPNYYIKSEFEVRSALGSFRTKVMLSRHYRKNIGEFKVL